VNPGPGVFDHDLDSQPTARVSPLPARGDSVAPYQRLVVNPFLTVLALVITAAIQRWASEHLSLGMFELGFGLLALEFLLVQYHCRDCGATGFLIRFRRHVCPAVLARWNQREWPRFRGPGVRAQLVGWFILLLSVTILVWIVRAAA
jgi:hypothetical protein